MTKSRHRVKLGRGQKTQKLGTDGSRDRGENWTIKIPRWVHPYFTLPIIIDKKVNQFCSFVSGFEPRISSSYFKFSVIQNWPPAPLKGSEGFKLAFSNIDFTVSSEMLNLLIVVMTYCIYAVCDIRMRNFFRPSQEFRSPHAFFHLYL